MTRRRLAAAAGLAGLGLLALGLGAVAADPVEFTRRVAERRLRWAGAVVERFASDDGRRLVAFELLAPDESGVPVVLLHGLGASGAYWTDAALFLRERGRTAILPDAPGSGSSEAPVADAGWGLAARVAGVERLALALGLERFDLVGHSLGGWTAARYAMEHPKRVNRLVLVDPGGFEKPASRADADRWIARLSPDGRAGARRLAGLLFARPPFPFAGFVVDGIGRHYRAPAVARTLAAMREDDFLAGRERELPPGTVFVWGEEETLFPVEIGRRAASAAPEARLLIVTGVGHDGPIEAPRAFHDALARGLALEPVAR